MKSTLKIAFTGPNNAPVIRVEKKYSDDLRDIMVSQFFEKLQHSSTTCHVECIGVTVDGTTWEISPAPPEELHPALTERTSGLPSKYQIEDSVSTGDIFDGQVVAVKFTVGKVYYDILDKLSGKVIENIDSALVQDINNCSKSAAL